MAINKKLIHFKNKENFEQEVANNNILSNSIVFIQDSKEIYTHGTYYGKEKNIPVFDNVDQLNELKVGEIASVLASGGTPIDWDKVIAKSIVNNGATDIRISSFTVNTDYSGGTSEPQSESDFVVGLLDDFTAPTRYLWIAFSLDVNNADIGDIAYTNSLDVNFGIHYVLQNGTWDYNELRTLQSMIVPGDFIQAVNVGENPVPTSLIEKAFSVTTGDGSSISTFVKTEDGYINLLAMLTKEQAQDMFATKNELPTKVSQLENDANYFVDVKPLPENGIYIYDIDGNFVNPSAWDTTNNSKAVGVAVLNDNCKFVIAKEDVPQSPMYWDPDYNQDVVLPNISFPDYNGTSNTSTIVAAYGTDTMYAALACMQYTFVNGKQGYLGAYDEWNIVKDNVDTVNEALTLIGGSELISDKYWTSSEMSNTEAYYVSINSFSLGMYDKKSSCFVRAFLPIDSTKPILQRLDEIEAKSGISEDIIHSGNIGSQSVAYATSAGNADLFDGRDSIGYGYCLLNEFNREDINTIRTGFRAGKVYAMSNAISDSGYRGLLEYGAIGYVAQFSSDSLNKLYYRWSENSVWNSWRTVAFEDSNVASATKLQTPRTIWGQSFDGTGDVSGAMNDVTEINGSSWNEIISKPDKTLTIGGKTYNGNSEVVVTAADLGLDSALKYHGTSSTAIIDGSTTKTITLSNGTSHTAENGCVVAYGNKEFVWNGSSWEELGNEGNYKVKLNIVNDPTSSGSASSFIDSITLDANGVITVTKKTVDTVDGYHISVVASMPSNPASNTIYLVI